MKIEKISETQIRCTLNRADLQSRELKISELAYGTEKAKNLFHDMIEQASHQFGFEADDLPLMIEAIPVSPDCIVLIITKVDDPEELDTRFSRFAPSDDDVEEYTNPEDSFGFDDLLPDMDPEMLSDGHTDDNSSDRDFIPMSESLGVEITENNNKSIPDNESGEKITKIFSFRNWAEASKAASDINMTFNGDSRFYKDSEHNRYLLSVTGVSGDNSGFFFVCNVLSEYGTKESYTPSTVAYLEERCELIIKKDALTILKLY